MGWFESKLQFSRNIQGRILRVCENWMSNLRCSLVKWALEIDRRWLKLDRQLSSVQLTWKPYMNALERILWIFKMRPNRIIQRRICSLIARITCNNEWWSMSVIECYDSGFNSSSGWRCLKQSGFVCTNPSSILARVQRVQFNSLNVLPNERVCMCDR